MDGQSCDSSPTSTASGTKHHFYSFWPTELPQMLQISLGGRTYPGISVILLHPDHTHTRNTIWSLPASDGPWWGSGSSFCPLCPPAPPAPGYQPCQQHVLPKHHTHSPAGKRKCHQLSFILKHQAITRSSSSGLCISNPCQMTC